MAWYASDLLGATIYGPFDTEEEASNAEVDFDHLYSVWESNEPVPTAIPVEA
jgi:hypothetical protein